MRFTQGEKQIVCMKTPEIKHHLEITAFKSKQQKNPGILVIKRVDLVQEASRFENFRFFFCILYRVTQLGLDIFIA